MTKKEFIKTVAFIKRYDYKNRDDYQLTPIKIIPIKNKQAIRNLEKFYDNHINVNPEILYKVKLACYEDHNKVACGKKTKPEIVAFLTPRRPGLKQYVLTTRKRSILHDWDYRKHLLVINDFI